MHFPVGVEEGAHVVGSEKVRRPMRAVGHADLPVVRVVWLRRRGDGVAAFEAAVAARQPQHIARAQRAAAVATEPAERKGCPAAEIFGNVETSAHREVVGRN